MPAPPRPRGAQLLVLSPFWGRYGGAEHVLVLCPPSRYPEPAAGPVRAGAISRSHSGAIYNPNCCLQLVSELSRALWLRRVTSCHRGGTHGRGTAKGWGSLGWGHGRAGVWGGVRVGPLGASSVALVSLCPLSLPVQVGMSVPPPGHEYIVWDHAPASRWRCWRARC